MGCGKTTFGKKTASVLNIPFIDLDDYIEEKEKRTIKHIFETDGEKTFRKIENKSLLEVIHNEKFVLATGGGTPCFFDNLKTMKEHGITLYLELDIKSLVNRLLNAKIYRPLIWGKSVEELTEYVKKTLKSRNVYYKKAHIIINGLNPDIDKIAKKIIKKNNKIGKKVPIRNASL